MSIAIVGVLRSRGVMGMVMSIEGGLRCDRSLVW